MHGASLRWIGTVKKSGMRPGLIGRSSAIAGRMACVLAAALLACASSAYSQVIEEGGFPVKGGGVSGVPFSLSCPSRLVAGAGESLQLSCSARGVPEEGVRYEWESLSGDGLHLLSDANKRSPLFTAPVSGEGAGYVYRLTAMSVGVYETAAVTVIVGVAGGSVQDRSKLPGLLGDCDSFGALEGFREGCVAGDKMPPSFEPFEGTPEGEGGPGFLFPEAPGLPDRPSGPVRGGGLGRQAPPRLECPVAVFLEELETGQVECHAWDASGEEYLEYLWEPAGSTTRDYLDNPRLLPEDVPNPSVVAPEVPVYETLESFRSGETTFRYRYRLTVTSRATGLSSSSEVEVFVSSSRPSVYCPLEVVVEEGSTVVLDCEGVDPLSGRMDYDEDGASIEWKWEGLWGTSTAPLDETDLSSPLFTAPAGSAGEEYHYIASMTSSASGASRMARRRVTVTGQETEENLSMSGVEVHCSETSFTRYAGSDNLSLNCWGSGFTNDYRIYLWNWAAWGADGPPPTVSAGGWRDSRERQHGLDITGLRTATFRMPASVDRDSTYTYTLGIWAGNNGWVTYTYLASKDITITVLKRPAITVTCEQPVPVYEGSADIGLECEASGAPGADPQYTWSWSPTANLTDHDTATPTFDVPDDVPQDTTYTYTVTASAENADGTATVAVRVLHTDNPRPGIHCQSFLYPDRVVYEGSEDFPMECTVTNKPENSECLWTGSRLHFPAGNPVPDCGGDNTSWPIFRVPENLDWGTVYHFQVTLSGSQVPDVIARPRVQVEAKDDIVVTCAGDPYEPFEGSADFALNCSARNAPAGSDYAYVWEARGDTPDTALLSAADIASPTFYVPDEVDETTTYEYLLTASAENAEDGAAEVRVTVLNLLDVACASPVPVYEGSADITFDCEASGAPAGSTYEYEWTPRGNTQDTALLSATDIASPVFYVPDQVAVTTTYEYLLTVSAANSGSSSAMVTVTVLSRGAFAVVCTDPGSVYEESADIAFDCEASGAPAGSTYEYVWTPRGDTPDTALLSAADIASPVFYVPGAVDATTTYEYLLTVSAANAESSSARVTVTVLNKGALAVVCSDPGSVYEGSADITFDCEASGAPGSSTYEYAWTARGDTGDTSLLSATNISSPVFYVPGAVDATTTYEYLLTVSAANAESSSARVAVTVLNKGTLAVVCTDPGSVYEGSEDITFDCSASKAPGDNPQYTYAWTARGATANTDQLSATDISSPTFYVPEELDETKTYEYLLTASAENTISGTAEAAVTVLNRGPLSVVCTDTGSIYEGSADFELDCSASGAPSGSEYAYAWTARGATANTAQLSATDISSPTFYVPDAVDEDQTYEYLLTASAENAISGTAEVSVTVLNKDALAVVCADPGTAYEGSDDIAFDCEASGAPGDNPQYTYVWTAQGDAQDTALLSAADIASPTFHVPEEVDEDETYEYLLTASAPNADDATTEVTVTVLNKGALAVVCADPGTAYEGSDDIAFDCEASGAPGDNPQYTYVWTARGNTPDVSLLSAADIASPTFSVPDEVDEDETYEYTLTASAANAEDAAAEVTVTVLNKGALAVVCLDPGSVYEGSEDIAFDCTASGAPGDNPEYTYVWTASGDTPDVSLLSDADIASPTFYVPAEVDEDEAYEYTLTVSAANAEDATVEVTVTVLDRIQTPDPDPVSPPMASSSSAREPAEPSALGVTVSASPLRFGMQSAETEVSLDPMTDQISTHVSGPYHAGRMTLSPGGSEDIRENGEMDLSIELASPVLLKRAGAIEAVSLVLSPQWSLAESCEQLSSQTIGGLYTEVTLSDADCRLLRFGGELDLTDVPSGHYAGSMDLILRSGESEETHSVEVDVTVIPAQQVITIGPRGVRFSTSRELPAGLTEEQNLSIYPDIAFLTGEKPYGVFELSNPSLIPLEISVSARFGYTEATENGREVVVEDASGSRLSDLSEVVDIHPGVLVLMPGEKGLVRYGVKEGAIAAMAEKGYAAFFNVVSEPRQYVRSDQMPEEVSGEKTARVTMRVPGVYVPGEGASQLRATLSSISYVGSLSATFLVETQDHPFVGEVVAYDGDGRELGRRETLVYTRSRVRVPLDRMPEEGTVFLRFMPRGSGRAPEPASVRWDAPRRDIGAAGDKDGSTTTETLARKP